ncbi:transposition protein [Nitratireductor indicus C115]|uniref:Transposition protein n=1 Tax=Nitratireductor indicus C115 TaxID=1231190 RepID=K2P4V9_9HYPH|nr:TniB family NTP-binding protein [Nitratireductor indicus]EKF42406.1 transposition protein [Nitratireductor indicus C115]SFQ55672.1 TniB protein [Nitratireductor indicus]
MTDKQAEVAARVVVLRRIFAHHPAFLQLEEQFRLLLDRRRAELAAGLITEARGIAVVGASGSGKTTAIARLLSHTPGLVSENQKDSRRDVVSFQVPSPATLKFVGQTALEALGYPLRRNRTEMIIWEMVRHHLQQRKTLFLHLDEAQDLLRYQTPKMLQSVVRTLKSLMQTKEWPVGLILSGMPEVKDLLNHDPQLARRFYPVEFPRLRAGLDGERVIEIVASYADRTSMETGNTVGDDFAARLIRAADGEFGLVIELIIGAIEEALIAGDRRLDRQHFTCAFRRRSGCIDGLNPFLADDFERINVRELLQVETVR